MASDLAPLSALRVMSRAFCTAPHIGGTSKRARTWIKRGRRRKTLFQWPLLNYFFDLGSKLFWWSIVSKLSRRSMRTENTKTATLPSLRCSFGALEVGSFPIWLRKVLGSNPHATNPVSVKKRLGLRLSSRIPISSGR